jgi:hypothetical protein
MQIRGPPMRSGSGSKPMLPVFLCGGGEISRRNRFGIGWSAPSQGLRSVRVQLPSTAPLFLF